MKLKTLFLCVSAAILTGCATPLVWYQPGKTATQAYQDFSESKFQAAHAADPLGLGNLHIGRLAGNFQSAGDIWYQAHADAAERCKQRLQRRVAKPPRRRENWRASLRLRAARSRVYGVAPVEPGMIPIGNGDKMG